MQLLLFVHEWVLKHGWAEFQSGNQSQIVLKLNLNDKYRKLEKQGELNFNCSIKITTVPMILLPITLRGVRLDCG